MDWGSFLIGLFIGVVVISMIFVTMPKTATNRRSRFSNFENSVKAQRAIDQVNYIFSKTPVLLDYLQQAIGSLDVALNSTPDPSLREHINKSNNAVIRLRDILNEILSLSDNETLLRGSETIEVGIDPEKPALIVDDNDSIRKTTEAMLSSLGFKCELAENGTTALKKMSEREYGVIFLDISMPDISGIEVAKQLRSTSGPNKKSPVIALTGMTRKGERDAIMSSGVNGYIAKPVKAKELEQLINSFKAA